MGPLPWRRAGENWPGQKWRGQAELALQEEQLCMPPKLAQSTWLWRWRFPSHLGLCWSDIFFPSPDPSKPYARTGSAWQATHWACCAPHWHLLARETNHHLAATSHPSFLFFRSLLHMWLFVVSAYRPLYWRWIQPTFSLPHQSSCLWSLILHLCSTQCLYHFIQHAESCLLYPRLISKVVVPFKLSFLVLVVPSPPSFGLPPKSALFPVVLQSCCSLSPVSDISAWQTSFQSVSSLWRSFPSIFIYK